MKFNHTAVLREVGGLEAKLLDEGSLATAVRQPIRSSQLTPEPP